MAPVTVAVVTVTVAVVAVAVAVAVVVVEPRPAGAEESWPAEGPTAAVEVVVVIRTSAVGPAPTSRRSSSLAWDHSGTLPCLRRGSSSRLVASIRNPATSFWRVSAGSITSSM